jgi:glycosyltransferase involved in cell wall biosynthesis
MTEGHPSDRRADGPTVSVVMAAFNEAEFIASAIESFLAQTYEDSELIVVDDASTDGTPEIVERYARRATKRIRLFRLDARVGPARARNVALEHARGELIALLDADDLWLSTKLEEQVAILRGRPEVGLVYSYFEAFDSRTDAPIDWPDGQRDIEGDILADLFFVGCFLGSLTAMFRRTALETRRPHLNRGDMSFGDDYWLWLVIALDWQAARVPRVLARSRRHGQSHSIQSAQGRGHIQPVELLTEFLAEYPEACRRLGPIRRRGMARHLLIAARSEAERGHRWAAMRLKMQAVRWDPACLRRRERQALLAG